MFLNMNWPIETHTEIMDIKAQIQKDRVEALKQKQPERKATLDYILGEIQKKEKDPSAKGDLAASAISAYIKSLRKFIAQHGSRRPEEAAKFQKEIELLSAYLPPQDSQPDNSARPEPKNPQT
jgi:uncharacterized protein YqeY